jgi:hypothetical protein
MIFRMTVLLWSFVNGGNGLRQRVSSTTYVSALR